MGHLDGNDDFLRLAFEVLMKSTVHGIALFDSLGHAVHCNDRFTDAILFPTESFRELSLSGVPDSSRLVRLRDAFYFLKSELTVEPLSIKIPVTDWQVNLTMTPLYSHDRFSGIIVMETPVPLISPESSIFSREAVHRPYIIHDASGKVLDCNLPLIFSLGHSPSSISAKSIFEIEVGLTDETLNKRIETLNAVRTTQFRTAYLNWDGTPLSGDVTALLIESEGQSTICNVIRFDEAELENKSAHNMDHFRIIFDSLPVAALLWSRTGNTYVLDLFNEAAEVLTDGMVKTAVNRTIDDIFVGMPEVALAIEEAMESRVAIRGEIPCDCPRIGLEGIFVLSFSRVTPDSIIMTITDITKHIALQKRLNRKMTELSEFAHDMNHDIRGLLHRMNMHLDILEEDVEHSRISDIREVIEMIDRLLTSSVLLAESGLVVGEYRCCGLRDMIGSVAKMVLPPEVKVEVADLPAVMCDESKVTQMFMNIFHNAIYHGNATSIEVSAEMDESYLNLVIRNNGRPIPPELRSSLFRKKVSTKQHGGGRGLLIVRKIAEAHGWGIRVLSTNSPAFCISIPKRQICEEPTAER